MISNKKGVFKPTGTSQLLYKETLKIVKDCNKVLDLGCGSGLIGISILEKFPKKKVYFSDVSKAAIEFTTNELKKKSLICAEIKVGSGLVPWEKYLFDLIICDVAAVSSKLDTIAEWYKNDVPNNAGEDGTENIINVIKKSNFNLNDNGKILFTVISLSNHNKILDKINSHFKKVDLVKKQPWPFPKEFYSHLKLLKKLKEKKLIDYTELLENVFYFDTYIYLAYR